VAQNDRVSETPDDEGHQYEDRQFTGRVPGPLNRQWMLAAAGAFVVVAIVAIAGVASLWDPDLDDRATGAPPPREYGGPLWFTVGASDETQLVTNTLPRGVPGPGSPYNGVAKYLPAEKCFTDGTNLLVWPRGSRPLNDGGRAGVNPGDGVDIFDGDAFSANAETVLIETAQEFPPVPEACAPSGNALSLSAVSKS
jgi:hypothetical protein